MKISPALFSVGLAAPLLLSTLLPLSAGTEKHSLLPSVKVEDQFVYDYETTASARSAEYKMKVRTIMSVTSLQPHGTITFKNERKEGEMSLGGKTQKLPDSSSIARFKVTGELLSVEPVPPTPEQRRFSRLMQMRVPSKPVTRGQSWT